MHTEHLLLTNATLRRCLADVQERAASCDTTALAQAWREAHGALQRLCDKESGCADDAPVLPLPPAMAPWVDALTSSPEVNRAHRLVPVVFGLVEFDALMTTQHIMRSDKLEGVRARLPAQLDDAALAALCLPLKGAAQEPAACHWDGQELQVISTHDDVQLLHVEPLATGAPMPAAAPGAMQAALHVALGQPLPVMHAVQFQGRVLLVKGHHRATVLRAAGATYVPCLISWCTSIDEVLAAASSLARDEVAQCFAVDRPAMLRDFGRAALIHSYAARARRLMLQVRVEVTRQWLP